MKNWVVGLLVYDYDGDVGIVIENKDEMAKVYWFKKQIKDIFWAEEWVERRLNK